MEAGLRTLSHAMHTTPYNAQPNAISVPWNAYNHNTMFHVKHGVMVVRVPGHGYSVRLSVVRRRVHCVRQRSQTSLHRVARSVKVRQSGLYVQLRWLGAGWSLDSYA